MKTIVFANQKGGVGKTAESVHLSFLLEETGYRVAHVDLDPQRNSSRTLAERRAGVTAIQLFVAGAVDVADNEGITLFEATPDLLDLDQQPPERMFALRDHLSALEGKFDYCVIDTPPSLGFKMYSALIASDFVVSPIELDVYSIDGIAEMLTTIFGIKQQHNPKLEFVGMLANRFNSASVDQKRAFETLVSKYAQFMIPAKITGRTSIATALREGVPVWKINSTSGRDAAKEMRHALGLVMERIGA